MPMSPRSLPARWLAAIRAREQALAAKYPWFRRRNYLLYKFQTKYALALIFLSVFITITIGVVMYRLFHGNAPTDGLDDGAGSDRNFRWLMLGLAALMVTTFGCFFVLVVLTTHRVAGPLVVMSRYMSQLASGQYPSMRPLRENDELKEFFLDFKGAVDRLRQRDIEESKTIEKALETLSPIASGSKAQELLAELRLILENKRRALHQEKSPPAEVTTHAA